MITELTDLPADIIGFEASGKLEAEDYRDVLLPAVERASANGDVRMVLVISSFDGRGEALPTRRTGRGHRLDHRLTDHYDGA